jgi:hypothetical protein
MNHNKLRLITTLITLGLLLPVTPGYSQDATGSAEIDLDLIKENVRKRIQDVVKIQGEQDLVKTPIAYTGVLLSLANDTLTIETQEGVKLASLSAQTTYARLPDESSANLDDISIEDYVLALGFINGSDVMDARRIISQKTIPQPSDKSVFYGYIDSFDSVTNSFTLTNPQTAETVNLVYTRQSDLQVKLGLDEAIPFDEQDELPPNASALVVYTDQEDPQIDTMVIKELVTVKITPATASAQLDVTVPPELRR